MLAGCQAMGFGGVNIHTFLEAPKKENKVEITLSQDTSALMASWQDTEVFVFSSPSSGELLVQVKEYQVFILFYSTIFLLLSF